MLFASVIFWRAKSPLIIPVSASNAFWDLTGSSIDGKFTVTETLTPPTSINIDKCAMKKDTVIRSEVGRPSIKLVARHERPDFHGNVLFENVSLTECRLLGNPINRLEMRNVEWNRAKKRAILYDKLVRPKEPAVVNALKEAYQILKERYRTLGDHITSGGLSLR